MNKLQERIEDNAAEIAGMLVERYGENNVICYHGKIWYRKANEDNWDGMEISVGKNRTRKSIETYIDVRESYKKWIEEEKRKMKEYIEKHS